MAVGLNHYLKNYCLTTISWYKDDPIELPKTLPNIPAEVTIKANVPNAFLSELLYVRILNDLVEME